MAKIKLADREVTISPLNFRVIRRLMESGAFEKLSNFSSLRQEEQLDVMVAFVAASTGEKEDWLWENLGINDVNLLPVVFAQVLQASGFKGESSPNVESP